MIDVKIQIGAQASKALSIVSGLLTLIPVVAQWTTLPPRYLWVSVSVAVLSFMSFLFWQDRYRDHLRHPARSLSQSTAARLYQRARRRGYATRFLRDEAEVLCVSRMDHEAYGDAGCIGDRLLIEWWEANRGGILALTDRDDAIVGAIGMFPLKKKIYKRIRSGKADETQIRGTDIVPVEKADRCRTWYLSDMVVQRSHQNTGAIFVALSNLSDLLQERLCGQGDIEVLAIGFSDGGRQFLKKFGFNILRTPQETDHGYGVYLRTFDGCTEMIATLERNLNDRASGGTATGQDAAAAPGR